MRIFFLAPSYLNLEKDILAEMQRQGHDVVMVHDRHDLPFDFYLRPKSNFHAVKNAVKRVLSTMLVVRKRYWINIASRNPELQKPFDFFLCINGSSFHPWIMRFLKKRNPAMRSYIYIWDSNSYRDFFHSIGYFDRAISFDLNDCRSVSPALPYLPFYWVPTNQPESVRYDISMIGSAHGHRVAFLNKILKRLNEKSAIRHFFRIYSPTELKEIGEEYQIHTPMHPSEVNEIISASRCILDTSRDGQGGTTPRFIWALAQGKKIITTNSYIAQMPFYRPEQIKIVDVNNPEIDSEFLLNDCEFDVHPFIENLRIDRWVHTLLQYNIPDSIT